MSSLVFFLCYLILGREEWLITSISFLPLLVLLSLNLFTRSKEIFTTINFIILASFLGITLRTIYICLFPDDFTTYHLMGYADIAILYESLALIIVGFVFLSIGYCFTKKPLRFGKFFGGNTSLNTKKIIFFISVFQLIGMASVFLYIESIGFGALAEQISIKRNVAANAGGGNIFSADSGYLSWASSGSNVALMLLLVLGGKRGFGKFIIFFIAISFVFTLVVPLLSSSRASLINPIMLFLIYIHRRIYKFSLVKVLVFSLLLILVLALMSVLRTASQQKITFSEAITDFSISEVYQSSIGNRHFLGVAKTALIVEHVPEDVDFQYGSTMMAWVFLPVPRYLWSSKPDVRPGLFVGREILGQGDLNGTPPGAFGELYLNGGWLFTIIGMLLIGAFLRKIDLAYKYSENLNGIAFFVLMTLLFNFSFKLFSSDLGGAIIDSIKILLPLFLIVTLAKNKKSL